jgi:uncharacterized protein
MRPFFFGSSKKPLFGVHHPLLARPTTKGARGAVLICNPFGREYLRAHRGLRELADKLSQEGLQTLRFDYYGSGDSAGEAEDGDVEHWLDDITVAAVELRDSAATSDISAVGLRLGASLAVLATERGASFSRLVLWDPVVVGRKYLDELLAQKSAWEAVHGSPAERPPVDDHEVLGFPLSPSLQAAIAAIDLRHLERAPAERALVMSSGATDDDIEETMEALRALGVDVTHQQIPWTKFWLRQEGIDDAVVPTETVRAIASWFGGGGW